jgi:hypothetical protein
VTSKLPTLSQWIVLGYPISLKKNFICCLRGWLMIIPWHDIERGRRLNRLRSSVLLTGLNLAVRTKRCIFNAFRTFDWQETVMLHLLIGHTHM